MTTTSHPTPEARWTILLVDDEPDILGAIQLVLERSKKGMKVLTASSGPEALQILGKTRLDLLISDFKMPVMDGIAFLAQARELRPELPRVMFTAYADAELSRRAFAEASVVDFLPKTMAPKELVEKVEALLAEHAGPGGTGTVSGQDSAEPMVDPDGVTS